MPSKTSGERIRSPIELLIWLIAVEDMSETATSVFGRYIASSRSFFMKITLIIRKFKRNGINIIRPVSGAESDV